MLEKPNQPKTVKTTLVAINASVLSRILRSKSYCFLKMAETMYEPGSVKDDDDEVEDKKCNKSEQTDKNDGPVDNGMKRVGIVALRKIRRIFQFVNSGLSALDDIKCPFGQVQPFF